MSEQRKFRVGDKVQWYEVNGCPIWDYDCIQSSHGVGQWIEGIVDEACDSGCKVNDYWWPQPDHRRACYGEPGYLELVEAAPEPRYRVVGAPAACSVYIEDGGSVWLSLFPESCRAELEAICEKLNAVQEPNDG